MTVLASRIRLAMVTLMVTAVPVLAQQRWSAPNKEKGMLQWVVMLGILILVCIPAFMNPKRSHQS